MASPSKQLVSVTFGSSDYDIGQSVRRCEDYRRKTNLEDQLGLLPVLTFKGSTDDETYMVENSLMALKVRRVEEYRQPVYIPPMAKANLQAKDEDLFPLMAKVQEFLDSDRQVMLILGDSGAGKSTFNRHLEHHLWTHYTNGDPIPLIINLPAIERPDQDMITKQLQMHDISNDQIQEMKHHYQFILICDGYDESQLTANLHQTNRLNQRGQWRTKMIISCRTQFLGPVYLDRFAPQLTDRYTKARSDLFQEAVIAPFSTKQVEDYVARYVPLEPRPWVTEDYMLMLTTIPNLMDLVRNPFLLTLTLEALPRAIKDQKELSTISISRVQLYDCFVNEWLGVNMRRLRDNKLTDNEREILEHMIEKGFIFLGVEYSKKLAAAIFVRNGGKPVVQYLHYDHKNTWRAKFFGPKSEVRFLRESSPLTRTGSLYRFIHRSMLEYFFSRTVFDPSTHGDEDEFAPQPDFRTSDVQPLDPNSPLFTRSLLKESSIIQFLRERVKQSYKFEKQLRAVIELSKTDARTAIAAANAMTILVRAGSLFNGADLQGIRIPGADLSGGQFDSAQLQGADLRGVNFTRSWLRQTNLTRTRMEGVRFGELPYLKEEDEVTACAYSPDGTRFVTGAVGDESGIINVYDTTTWTKINTFHLDKEKDFCPPNRITIKSIAFSPDSRHFVTGSDDGTVRLWVCANGLGGLKMKEGPDKNQVWVAFSPCGKKVASACEGGSARFWDAETGETVFVMEGYTGGVKSIECSPDGNRVVLGCNDGTIRFWDALTGEQGAVWNASSRNIFCLAYAPDGRLLASGHYEGVVQLWDTMSGEAVKILRGDGIFTTDIAFSPDSRWVATTSGDSTVRLWDVRNGTLVSTFPGHTEEVLGVAFSPNGRQLATAGRDAFVRLWDVDSSEASVGWKDPIDVDMGALFTVDGYLILARGGSGESVRLWNPLTGTGRPPILLSSRWLTAGAISPDGKQITLGGRDGVLRAWNCQTGEAGPTVEAHHEGYVWDIVYSPCGRWILSTSAVSVQLWDLQSPKRVRTVGSHERGYLSADVCAAFSMSTTTETRIAVADWTGKVELYAPHTNGSLNRIELSYDAKPYSMAFSPNGGQLAIGTERHSIELWNYQTEKEPKVRLQGHSRKIYCLAYSFCGQWLASSSLDRTVRIWRRHTPAEGDEVESWSCATVVRGFFEGVQRVSWNPYGPLEFFTKSVDNAVRIWRVSVGGDCGQKCVTVHLVWGSNLGRLCTPSLRFEGGMGLDPVYEKLLLQRGAINASIGATATDVFVIDGALPGDGNETH